MEHPEWTVAPTTTMSDPPPATLVRPLPRPLAIWVGSEPPRAATAAINNAGLELVRVDDFALPDFLDNSRRVTLTLLTPGVRSTERIRQIRRSNPRGRILMLADQALPADELLTAIRAGVNDVLDTRDSFSLQRVIGDNVAAAVSRRERILVIGAHPDDVEIGAAGTILEHSRRGDAVTVLTLSRGAVGGDRDVRLGEAQAAAEAMDTQLLIGDFPDTRIDGGAPAIRFIESVVGSFEPSIVYVHSSNDGHQDHRAVHTATLAASRRVPRLYCYHSPSSTNQFLPTRFVPIDDTLSGKLHVLGKYASQGGRTYLEADLVVAQARFWARSLAPHARYAEAFEVVREMSDQFPQTRVRAGLEAESDDARVIAMPS
jgi:LmbE family N-acetylglucosaminyl deacetylase